jgi:hypothetical protein
MCEAKNVLVEHVYGAQTEPLVMQSKKFGIYLFVHHPILGMNYLVENRI